MTGGVAVRERYPATVATACYWAVIVAVTALVAVTGWWALADVLVVAYPIIGAVSVALRWVTERRQW